MTATPLRPWVFMAEWYYDDINTRGINYYLDGWEDAGYETIMFGRFDLRDGDTIHPSFAPDLSLYQETSLQPPPMPAHLADRSERLQRAMEAVKARGFGVCLFSPDPYLAIGPEARLFDVTDRDCVAYYHARLRDAYQHYPMADRILMDSPEWSYEPQSFRYRKQTIFNEFDDRPGARAMATALGYDLDRILAALRRLEDRLGHLDAATLERFLAGQRGSLDGLDLLLWEPGLWEWFAFRHDVIANFLDGLRAVVRGLNPALKLGLGPRLPTWARITGCSLKRIAEVTDFQAPKIYMWKGGFDGYQGTLQRYADYLLSANPGLPEELCLAALTRGLGIDLPDLRVMADFQREFTPSYFDVTLASEIRKIRADVGDLDEIVPYVEVGPHPHGGEPITTAHFEQIVATIQREGLKRFIHYWHGQFDDEVRVVKQFTRA